MKTESSRLIRVHQCASVAQLFVFWSLVVRSLYQRLRDLLTRRIRYKITRGGLLFSFAIAMVAFGAVASANNLLFLIVAAMMATLLVRDRKSTRLNSSHEWIS